MSTLLNSEQACAVLTLGHYKYLKYLNDRGLLPRIILGPRTFRYEQKDCEDLLKRAKLHGISLTEKPRKAA